MNGYYIESKPLTPEMATEVIRLLGQVNISASSSAQMLMLISSLERISTGTDDVKEK